MQAGDLRGQALQHLAEDRQQPARLARPAPRQHRQQRALRRDAVPGPEGRAVARPRLDQRVADERARQPFAREQGRLERPERHQVVEQPRHAPRPAGRPDPDHRRDIVDARRRAARRGQAPREAFVEPARIDGDDRVRPETQDIGGRFVHPPPQPPGAGQDLEDAHHGGFGLREQAGDALFRHEFAADARRLHRPVLAQGPQQPRAQRIARRLARHDINPQGHDTRPSAGPVMAAPIRPASRHRVFGMEPSFRALSAPFAPPPARPGSGALFSRGSRVRPSPVGLPVATKAAGPPAARQGGPAPCVMACHVLSWSPCGQFIAIRQSARLPRHGTLLASRPGAMRPAPARPCCGTLFRAVRVRARPRAFRGGAPDCACARTKARRRAQISRRFASGRESRRPASRPGRQGGPAPCVMECHAPVMVSMQAVHSHPPIRPASPASRLRHGSLLSSLVLAPCARRRPGHAAEPCFRAVRVRARPRAFRGGAPDCACARARRRGAAAQISRRFASGRESRRPASRPTGQGGTSALCHGRVMSCHGLHAGSS